MPQQTEEALSARFSTLQGSLSKTSEGMAQQKPTGLLTPFLKAASPTIVTLGQALNIAGPYLERGVVLCFKAWDAMEPYDPEAFIPAICGLLMVFFGGHFPLIVGECATFHHPFLRSSSSTV